MKNCTEILLRSYSSMLCYWRCQAAAIAISFAFVAPVVIGAAGFALDYAQAYLVQQRLLQAIDAAALAGAAASDDEAVIKQKVQDFFDINYPPEKVGFTVDPVIEVTSSQVKVRASAHLNTTFLRVLNIDRIDINANTTVDREIQAIEVVLVLDNTGSMSSNDNITSLKEASTNFINIMFDSTANDEMVKIGIVPYSNAVRVGSYGLGKNPDGSIYGDGEVFVNKPADVAVTTNHNASTGWYGCVVEHNPNNYDAAATYVTGSYGQLWRSGTDWDGHGWNPAVNTNDPYPGDVFADVFDGEEEYAGPWDIYQYSTVDSTCQQTQRQCTRYYSNGSCRTWSDVCVQYNYTVTKQSRPNESCPYAQIVPLTSDHDYLLTQVDPDDDDVMFPHGNTLGNVGMVWGGRLLSPEPPFTEAKAWDNEYWRKAIVMMTDGDNTENGTYSAFSFTGRNNMTVTKFNQRFEETCTNLKKMGVLIYTVTFTSGISPTTKGYYERCATTSEHYFDAPTQEDLQAVFERIARELSVLHISE